MNKLDILTLPLSGSHLIEASAGTGKTYTIAALYVRLILSGALAFQRELSPANILVVTFTDAATKELRDRIRARLSEAAQYFRAPADVVDKDEFLRDLRASYSQETWLGCAKRIDVAANFMDESAIYTIHGWCKKMLQQHAFDSLSPFLQDVLTNEVELLNKVVTDYWRIHFYVLSKPQCQLIVSKIATSPDGLLKAIKPALFQTEKLQFDAALPDISAIFDSIEKWQAQRQNHENKAKQAWLNDKTAINALLTQASEEGWLNGNRYRRNTFQQKLTSINTWAEGLNQSIDSDDLGKFGLQRLTHGLVAAHQAKVPQFTFDAFRDIDDYVNYLEDQKSIDTDFKQAIHRHAIQWMRNRYEEEKQTLACMTFNDMINRLDYALDEGDNAQRLANVIREQYPIALIDEFQDTDPVQYRIFSKIYQPQDHAQPVAWFMIGDPKQAIYSFRGADIH
ncbi:MAG: UvrD-helicase domain-containing protein, partial [Methylococcales bacterium]|nr:UvrD-helicase domain-containing protein [Methylococcales bacterium]